MLQGVSWTWNSEKCVSVELVGLLRWYLRFRFAASWPFGRPQKHYSLNFTPFPQPASAFEPGCRPLNQGRTSNPRDPRRGTESSVAPQLFSASQRFPRYALGNVGSSYIPHAESSDDRLRFSGRCCFASRAASHLSLASA